MFNIWIAALLLISSFSALSSDISVEKISNELHILSGNEYGTNIGLIALENGVALIDPMPGTAHLAELNKTIQSIYGKSVSFIFNTHTHSDHTGGNEFFIKQGGKLVENNFNVNGMTRIQVNSHTAVDYIYYHEKSNVIFAGDVFDASWHPTFYSGGTKGFDEAISIILRLGDDKTLIIPGHGKPSTKSSLLEFRANTFEWVSKIRELSLKGLSVEKIMENEQVKTIVDKFNVDNQSPFLPEKAYRRFIERTITVIENEKTL